MADSLFSVVSYAQTHLRFARSTLIGVLLLSLTNLSIAGDTRQFDIAEQSAEVSLNEFALQAEVSLLFVAEEVRGVTTGRLDGEFAVEAALTRLLAGTRLQGRINEWGVLTVTPMAEVAVSATRQSTGKDTMHTKKSSIFGRIGTAIATAIFATSGATVTAAEDADSDTSGVVEEIIVTATYRDTRLMETPIAISAVTAEDIQFKGIEDIQTLYQSIPGLSYRTGTQTLNFLSVRGITPPAGGGSSVGVYLDNIPMTDNNSGGKSQPLGSLFDMARVEVLKGPQGTLYGEGNMGGSIRYITNKVNPNEFEMSTQLGIEAISESDDLSYRADVMINVPLIQDTLGLRAAVYRRDRAGVLDQVAPANRDDVDTFEEDGYRVKLGWLPTDDLEISAMYNRVEAEYGGPGIAFHCFTESTPFDPGGQVPPYDLPGTTCAGQTDQFRSDPYVTHLAHPTFTNGGYDDNEMMNLSIQWELPFAKFTASTSSFEKQTAYNEETSPRGTAPFIGIVNFASCFGFLPVCGPNTLATGGLGGAFYRETESTIHEFRLVSNNTDSRWQWTVGAYFKDDESQSGEHQGCFDGGSPVYQTISTHCFLQWGFFPDVPIANQALVVQFLDGLVGGNTKYNDFSEESFYGEVSYRINDQWEILAGMRFADVTFDGIVGPAGVDTRSNPASDLSVNTRENSPKITLSWKPSDDTMIYGTVSEGFRPGLINDNLTARLAELDAVRAGNPNAEAQYQRLFDFQTVDGDSLTNYEIGIKSTILDGRVSYTASLYRIDWEDTIIAVTENITDIPGVTPFPFQLNINAGEATSEGIEIEVRAQLTEALSLNLGFDNNWEAKVRQGDSGAFAGVAVTPGNRLANAPKYSAYLALTYDFQLFGYDATARLDSYAVDESWNTANNEVPAPAYETVDLRLTLRGNDRWRIAGYVRNVFDEEIIYEFNQVGYRFGRPRTVGLQFNYDLN
ncbi:TonB-dependent receptor [Gammaproteobacteria bacterium]|nr:TonB-dependent receptor [Gammaproteobacteria bacterium]